MPLFHLVLADYDLDYVSHLAQWFTENKPHQFRISVFTENESFARFISENREKTDIILAAEDFLVNCETDKNISVVLGQASKLSDLRALEKYQPAPAIYSEIMTILSDNRNESVKWPSSVKSELVVCFSSNIYLKSVMALLLSALSREHVYINLESFPFYIMEENFHNYNKNMSDILYHIKSGRDNPSMILESAVIAGDSINFIPPLDNPGDLWELTGDETRTFIEALKSWGRFPKIIVDPELNAGPAIIKILEEASVIIIPFNRKHMHQLPRIKNMLEGITGMDPGKIKWVCCGSSEAPVSGEFEYFHEISWINENIPFSLNGLALDQFRKRQLEELLTM